MRDSGDEIRFTYEGPRLLFVTIVYTLKQLILRVAIEARKLMKICIPTEGYSAFIIPKLGGKPIHPANESCEEDPGPQMGKFFFYEPKFMVDSLHQTYSKNTQDDQSPHVGNILI